MAPKHEKKQPETQEAPPAAPQGIKCPVCGHVVTQNPQPAAKD